MRPLRSLLASVLLLASPALAGDGVVEINQTCADQGCFCGDAPFQPVTITGCAGRSYRLTSDLYAGVPVISGIVVSAPDVSIDMGGFAIRGLNVCNGSFDGCAYSGTGIGIETTAGNEGPADRLHISNGNIVGLGSKAIFLGSGDGHRIRNVRVSHNGHDGVHALGKSVVVEDTTSLRNGRSGVTLSGSGGRVSQSIASNNGGDGIVGSTATTVERSTAESNGRDGISVTEGSAIRSCTASANGQNGIVAYVSGVVSDSVVKGNTLTGISMSAHGFAGARGGSIQGNTVTSNSHGIVTGTGVLVAENSISKNTNTGILLNPGSAYRGNLITENGEPVFGINALNLGDNGCTDPSNAVVVCP